MAKSPRIALPKTWPTRVKSAMLHVISLAQFAHRMNPTSMHRPRSATVSCSCDPIAIFTASRPSILPHPHATLSPAIPLRRWGEGILESVPREDATPTRSHPGPRTRRRVSAVRGRAAIVVSGCFPRYRNVAPVTLRLLLSATRLPRAEAVHRRRVDHRLQGPHRRQRPGRWH